MGVSSSRLYELLHRYHSGRASEPETDELMALISKSKNDEELTWELKKIWDELTTADTVFTPSDFDRMVNSIISPTQQIDDLEVPVLRPFAWFRYVAAAVLLLGALGAYRYFAEKYPVKSQIVAQVPTAIIPGGNKARLTLADGSTILLDSTSKGLIAQQGITKVSKTIEGKLEYITQEKSEQSINQQFNTITTPNGGQYQVVLPDGSTVWLNAASSIQFPTQFSSNERRVVITGEVYFEVKKDAAKPFRVNFGNAEVEVLGTSFNIMAYTNEASSQATLVEGAVNLKNGTVNRKLTPGQQGTIQKNGSVAIQSVDTEEVTAWKQGLFYFREADVVTVMKQVARWYDIDVQFERSSTGKAQKQFTGKVARNVKIEVLLDMLHYAGVDYRIHDRKLTIIN